MKISKTDKFGNALPNESSGLFFTNRQVGWIVSGITMFCFFVFMGGYFLGKKKAVEKFYSKIKEDSFADHVYYSMCSLYDKQGELVEQHDEQVEDVVVAQEDGAEAIIAQSEIPSAEQGGQSESLQAVKEECSQFYAELIGFGTHRAARKFADKLLAENISVSVKKRKSKTSRGKMITWYQVVTETFSDKSDLMALVDDVSSQERLKDVRIVSV